MSKEILEIAKRFHDTYEKLAKEYSYETREDTKVFNVNSNNGMLMYAVVNEIVSPILKENQELQKQLENKSKIDISIINYAIKCEDKAIVLKNQQKEFILYLRHLSNWYSADGVKQGMVNEILQKYEEIIGYKDE